MWLYVYIYMHVYMYTYIYKYTYFFDGGGARSFTGFLTYLRMQGYAVETYSYGAIRIHKPASVPLAVYCLGKCLLNTSVMFNHLAPPSLLSLGAPVVPSCPFFGVSLLQLNSRKKGSLIIKGLLGNLYYRHC